MVFWSTPSPMNAAVCSVLQEYAEAAGLSFTDAGGVEDADVVCTTQDHAASSAQSAAQSPAISSKRTLQLVLLRTPLEQAAPQPSPYPQPSP